MTKNSTAVVNNDATHIGCSAIAKKNVNLNFPGPTEVSKYKTKLII
jgi:hypothetical protein